MAKYALNTKKKTIDLKGNNAGYATRNPKTGAVTYYNKSSDAAGFNDTGTGKNVKTSAGNPMYTKDASGKVITPESMNPVTPAIIPKPTVLPDIGDVAGANNAGLIGTFSNSSYSLDQGKFVYDPTKSASENAVAESNQKGWERIIAQAGYAPQQESQVDLYNSLPEKKARERAQKEVNNYTNQINTITTGRDAAMLSLEGQGRGQTEGFIGGEQARINREAAIRALPVQAQLAAANGNLEMANENLNTMFKLKAEDSKAKYDRQKSLFDSVIDYATKAESNLLTVKLADIQKKETANQEFLKQQQSLMSSALGQGAPASVVSAINNAKTPQEAITAAGHYNGDVLGNQLKRASLYTESLQQQKLLNELNPVGDDSTNSDLTAYAQQYADTGKLPSVAELKNSNITASQITAYAKQVPKTNGAILSSNTGIKSAAISPAQEDGIAALYDIQNKIKQLKELDTQRMKGVTSAVLGKVFGSENQQRYIDLRGEIVDLLARARTGSALTSQEEKFYSDQLPGRVGEVGGFIGVNTQNRIDNFATKIQGTLETKLNSNGVVIQGYSKVNVPDKGLQTVGSILDFDGVKYRVLPDGTLTDII